MKHSVNNDDETTLTTNEARAGRRVKGMPLVLGISTLAAITVCAAAMIYFA